MTWLRDHWLSVVSGLWLIVLIIGVILAVSHPCVLGHEPIANGATLFLGRGTVFLGLGTLHVARHTKRYADRTSELVNETRRANEIAEASASARFRPYIVLRHLGKDAYLRNVGAGPAMDIQVPQEFRVEGSSESHVLAPDWQRTLDLPPGEGSKEVSGFEYGNVLVGDVLTKGYIEVSYSDITGQRFRNFRDGQHWKVEPTGRQAPEGM